MRKLSFIAVALFVAGSTGYVATEVLRELGLYKPLAGGAGGITFGLVALWLDRLHRRA